MDPTDAILMTIDSTGGEISGRTAIQKLIYFESLVLDINACYQPYYYGPYSGEVAGGTQSLVSLNFVKEEIDYKESRKFNSSEDWKKYSYKLSDDGKTVLQSIKEKNESNYDLIKKVVEICKRETRMDIHKLSCAAKVHYLTNNCTPAPGSLEKIQQYAECHGWQLSDDDIIEASDLIAALKAELPQI
ncbi:hypothetical protein [Methanocella sp. MCL-LM]|uniref:hypothetical protein n=1 Tax=Methanocella sp. MCL-LM TaxID=3412035 RepID=UPI003C70C785